MSEQKDVVKMECPECKSDNLTLYHEQYDYVVGKDAKGTLLITEGEETLRLTCADCGHELHEGHIDYRTAS